MDVHAPAAVFFWRGAVAVEDDSMAAGKTLRRVMELPHDVEGPGDHPEGMCRFQAEGLDGDGLLVVYDSPARRRQARGGLRADVFPLPRADWSEDADGRRNNGETGPDGGGGPRGPGLLGTVVTALAEAVIVGGLQRRPPSEGGPGPGEEGGPPRGEDGPPEGDSAGRQEAPREDDASAGQPADAARADGEGRDAPDGEDGPPANEERQRENREEGQG
jgi:hypothetical protein